MQRSFFFHWYYRILKGAAFIITIKNGRIVDVWGSVKPGLVTACSDVVAHSQLQEGIVYGVFQQGSKPSLQGSSSIPAPTLQQFRNVGAIYG